MLKQRRGNGGIGTWRVELVGRESDEDAIVRQREARRGAIDEELRLSEFMRRCDTYFSGSGCLIDQSFQKRVAEGMVRCYLVQDKVAGFSTQSPSETAGSPAFAMARDKTMYHESEARFQRLRRQMETEWIPGLQRRFALDTASLPAIWDADFLYGPRDHRGEDTYVLCEINVSAVFPFPPTAVMTIARAAMSCVVAGRKARANGA